MKHIDYLYFNIYNYFYKTSQDRQSFNTRIQAMYLFSLGSGGWLLLMQALYLHIIRHAWFSSQAESAVFAISIYILTAILFNYIFIVKHRDLQIFGKYEELSNQNPKRKWHLIISFSVLAMPYLALLFFAFFSPRHGQ
ncbi:MAG TPA: hypothetical protein VF939_13560 [Puia sp.]